MSTANRLLAIIVVLIWGFNFVIIRLGIATVHPITMAILRFLLTAFPMIFFVKKPDIPMRFIALYGVLFGGGIWGLVNIAIYMNTPAGVTSLLLQLSSFLTVIAATIFLGESITRQKVIGIIIAFAGFIIVCVFRSNMTTTAGITLVFLAAIFWTLCNIIIKITKPKDIISFVVWSSLFVPIPLALISITYLWATGNVAEIRGIFRPLDMTAFMSIIFQAYITTLMGYGIWTWLIIKNSLSEVAPFSLLVPISGLFFDWLLYQEKLPLMAILGSLLILCGLFMLSIRITFNYLTILKKILK